MTRGAVLRGRQAAIRFLEQQRSSGKRSKLFKASQRVLRRAAAQRFTLDFDHALDVLQRITFVYDDVGRHWAETDGVEITINTWRRFDSRLLEKTLIHEALHGTILLNGQHELPEHKEHAIMRLVDPELV